MRLGGGRVRASLCRVAESIFHPQVLELERAGGEGDDEGGGSGYGDGWA